MKKDSRLEKAGVEGFNKPKRTPSHPTKSHVVVAKEGEQVKTIRFGQQGVKTVTNFVYDYRTSSDSTLQLTSAGQLTVGPLGSGLTFPYGDGVLSTTQKKDFLIGMVRYF